LGKALWFTKLSPSYSFSLDITVTRQASLLPVRVSKHPNFTGAGYLLELGAWKMTSIFFILEDDLFFLN
jgi:hypothetical protein